jgi:DNA-binding transcriptional MocR family regulator
MPDAKKKALVELLARHELPLIEDDVYAELYFGERRPAPAKAFDTQGLVLHCSSFSKCLAPGYRIGWASQQEQHDGEVQRVPADAVQERGAVRAGEVEHRTRHPAAQRHAEQRRHQHRPDARAGLRGGKCCRTMSA